MSRHYYTPPSSVSSQGSGSSYSPTASLNLGFGARYGGDVGGHQDNLRHRHNGIREGSGGRTNVVEAQAAAYGTGYGSACNLLNTRGKTHGGHSSVSFIGTGIPTPPLTPELGVATLVQSMGATSVEDSAPQPAMQPVFKRVAAKKSKKLISFKNVYTSQDQYARAKIGTATGASAVACRIM